MKQILVTGTLSLASLFFVGCASNEKVEMGGVPAWLKGGAKLSDEPEPLAPDPAIQHFDREGGPIEFSMITDKRQYSAPPVKKATKPERDPLDERGRDYRIRRLVR